MPYITGDCHGDFLKFTDMMFPEQRNLTRENHVIVLGDVGLIYSINENNAEERFNRLFLEDRQFTFAFLSGNHENYDRLNAMKVSNWHGGKVHIIAPNVIHLISGQIYSIEGKTFFVFGGAKSHDITGGLLDLNAADFEDQYQKARKSGKPFRIKNINWWEQEMPSEREKEEGLSNLAVHSFHVDYILTHCCSTKIQKKLNPQFESDELTDYLEQIRQKASYSKWFFGHYHLDKEITDKQHAVYKNMINIQ